MKRLIKWVLLTYGTTKTTHLVDQLKTMGFHYATAAGISLGIDDLRVPPVKAAFMENAENEIYENVALKITFFVFDLHSNFKKKVKSFYLSF